ncbi:MAG: diaminopimelate decarboxylase [Gemmatimonadota bacterium]|jgi:diaminopimelate decarboxylase
MGAGVLTPAPVAWPVPDALARRDGVLHCEGVPLPVIAADVGTPAYVYSLATIRARYAALAAAFAGVPHRIHFAVKANSNLAVLGALRALGAGMDIVSGGELHRALAAGCAGEDVVFSGVGKTVAEIEAALRAGVRLLNVESEAELAVVDAVAARLGVVAPVAFRVNPEVTVDTPHAYIRTGEKGQKFGIPRDDIARVAAVAASLPHLRVCGVGMHLGSQIANSAPLRAALPRLLEALAAVRDAGHTVSWLDVGGGLAVPYAPGDPAADLADYADAVRRAVAGTGCTLLLEPGRFLVAEAGVLLTTVLYRKQANGTAFVVTDAGMGDLLRPSLYQAEHGIVAVTEVAETVVADVVGPICESGDFLARGRPVPDVPPGAVLAVLTSGAYGYTMASHYNSRPRPAEVAVEGDRYAVVAVRESVEELLRLERHPLAWRKA